jgi:sterol desaturase/sphingolipid hydroxylase (fatty acid hydroxylase superfamily)
MTWDVISRALFPAGDGGLLLMAGYWSVLAGLVGLEFFIPRHQNQNRVQRWQANFGLGFINMALVPLAPISGFLAALWAQRNGIGALNLLDSSWWPIALIATIAIQSFNGYLTHVLFHKASWLWRIHRVHHFDTVLDVSTGLRHHPIELILTLIIDSLVAIAFGLMPLGLFIYGTTDAIFALLSHANVRFPSKADRLLRSLFVTPPVHAVHHSVIPSETDSNYGTVLTIWDRLFRTYCETPANAPETIKFGISELQDSRANDFWWQLKSPSMGHQFREILDAEPPMSSAPPREKASSAKINPG